MYKTARFFKQIFDRYPSFVWILINICAFAVSSRTFGFPKAYMQGNYPAYHRTLFWLAYLVFAGLFGLVQAVYFRVTAGGPFNFQWVLRTWLARATVLVVSTFVVPWVLFSDYGLGPFLMNNLFPYGSRIVPWGGIQFFFGHNPFAAVLISAVIAVAMGIYSGLMLGYLQKTAITDERLGKEWMLRVTFWVAAGFVVLSVGSSVVFYAMNVTVDLPRYGPAFIGLFYGLSTRDLMRRSPVPSLRT